MGESETVFYEDIINSIKHDCFEGKCSHKHASLCVASLNHLVKELLVKNWILSKNIKNIEELIASNNELLKGLEALKSRNDKTGKI